MLPHIHTHAHSRCFSMDKRTPLTRVSLQLLALSTPDTHKCTQEGDCDARKKLEMQFSKKRGQTVLISMEHNQTNVPSNLCWHDRPLSSFIPFCFPMLVPPQVHIPPFLYPWFLPYTSHNTSCAIPKYSSSASHNVSCTQPQLYLSERCSSIDLSWWVLQPDIGAEGLLGQPWRLSLSLSLQSRFLSAFGLSFLLWACGGGPLIVW